MKISYQITDITKDDLTTLIGSVIYFNSFIGMWMKGTDYYGTSLVGIKDDKEDKLAKVLLSGKSIYIGDYEAEEMDESYGQLPHEWMVDHMRYTVSLKDFEKGLALAMEDETGAEFVRHLMSEPQMIDLDEAEYLMQFIVFGEIIYA